MSDYAPLARSRAATCAAALLLLLVLAPAANAAAEWTPDRPMRMLVQFPPGGTSDLLARIVATPLGTALGQQVVVDNRGGGNGTIAMDILARAQPNGYTFAMVSLSAHAGSAALTSRLPYDPINSFAPIMFIGHSPLVLVVHPSNAAQSVKDMIARGRAAGRRINFATSGLGIANHIAGELLKLSAAQEKVDMVHVPYKGGGPAMIAVMAGEVEMQFIPLSSVLSFVRGGKLRPLAITDQKRSSLLPAVPTMVEAGYPDFYILESFGLMAPAKTPPEIVRRLNSEITKILQGPDAPRLAAQGVELAPSTPDQLRAIMVADVKKYREVVQRAGITPE